VPNISARGAEHGSLTPLEGSGVVTAAVQTTNVDGRPGATETRDEAGTQTTPVGEVASIFFADLASEFRGDAAGDGLEADDGGADEDLKAGLDFDLGDLGALDGCAEG